VLAFSKLKLLIIRNFKVRFVRFKNRMRVGGLKFYITISRFV